MTTCRPSTLIQAPAFPIIILHFLHQPPYFVLSINDKWQKPWVWQLYEKQNFAIRARAFCGFYTTLSSMFARPNPGSFQTSDRRLCWWHIYIILRHSDLMLSYIKQTDLLVVTLTTESRTIAEILPSATYRFSLRNPFSGLITLQWKSVNTLITVISGKMKLSSKIHDLQTTHKRRHVIMERNLSQSDVRISFGNNEIQLPSLSRITNSHKTFSLSVNTRQNLSRKSWKHSSQANLED